MNRLMTAFIVLCSMVASLGVYPYAKNFALSLFDNYYLSMLIIGLIVPSAVVANIALGAYSLYNSFTQIQTIPSSKRIIILTTSVFSALSTGFMCFAGYNGKLPKCINVLVSLMVVLVNTGIGFSAINNAMQDVLTLAKKPQKAMNKIKKKPVRFLTIIFTVMIASMVSLTAYLASTHGLSSLVNYFQIFTEDGKKIIYPFAVLIWLPGAILFANSSRHTVSKLYKIITRMIIRRQVEYTVPTLIICGIAFFSGSAYAQMALEFLNSSKFIPTVFKEIAQYYHFVMYVFMPLAFCISAIVNGYALENLLQEYRKSCAATEQSTMRKRMLR